MLALTTLLFSACSESFLDSEPTTSLTDGNFYKTKKDAELAIVGCYDGVQAIYNNGIAFPVLSEVVSDNCFGGTGNTDGLNYRMLDQFDLQVSPGDVDALNNNWIAYYKSIYRCNVLLQKMDQIDWEDDTDYRNEIEAQARFLRAFAYFDMVRLWERVPLLTEPSDENIPQSPADSTYTVITKDLMFAAENGAESVEPGRVNKWAAKALLGRVYLYYTGYYAKSDLVGLVSKSEALQGLEDIVSSVGTTGYGLVPEYKNLWPAAAATVNDDMTGIETTYAGKDNMETLFAVKYNITSNYDGDTDGNHWLVMLGARGQHFTPYGKGWGACTVLPSLYQAYETDDTRKVASVIAFSEEGLDFDNSDQREYTGYTNKKYTPMSTYVLDTETGEYVVKDVAEANGAVNFQIGQFQDYVVMRYADVLLMAAELGSSNAQSYFDQVRERAGLTSKAVSKENIMTERRFEFAFEGLRYWDLMRQGGSVAASTIAVSTTVQDGGVDFQKVISASDITSKRGLMLIPQTQISLSAGVLTQNDGWN
ncbi:putative outer membrane starch-binding protein [Mangrovibacterium diazotrophicum]|uniref:Putative outer membrane starch-binding protein n=2 Tax=Mangrovibacterium diazotrophicum TaxID=1261403 RepID=A0A419W9E3_9BACT|nr:putative outer membrane starch-binding protein [Mangrovibacterium diazotrophicum]